MACTYVMSMKREKKKKKRTAGVNDPYNDAGSGVDAGPVAGQLLAKCILRRTHSKCAGGMRS